MPIYIVLDDFLGKVPRNILKNENFPGKILKLSTNQSVGLSFSQSFLKPFVRFGNLSFGPLGISVRLTSLV